MRTARWFFLLPACLVGQTTAPADPARLLTDLRSAIQSDSLVAAADLSGKLDEAVQQRYQAWLIRDVDQRVGEVLAWLPANTESIWVNQQPFTIQPERGLQILWRIPHEQYSVDRLEALNSGEFYKTLANRRVRLVVAGARNIRKSTSSAVPAPIAAQDLAYIFFFAEPIDLGPHTESIQGHPVWRATASVRQGDTRGPRDDENWLALARPDVLILTNQHPLLAELLEHVALDSKNRAMPANLPEWAHVDRTASFWGLRHYTDESRAKEGERGFGAADLPLHPDGKAIGVTVRLNAGTQQLEIVYLSPTQLSRLPAQADMLEREFKVDQPEAGVWRLVSDVASRGPFPVNFALNMLGFGIYQ